MSQPKQAQRDHPNETARRYGLMVLGSKGEAWSASNELGTSTGKTKREAVGNWVKAFGWKATSKDALKVGTNGATGIEAEVCKDIAERQRIGIAKYGTTVAENPLTLREWLQHAYEEGLDQCIYLKRAIADVDKATNDRDAWKACAEQAEQYALEFASHNPKHVWRGEMQDPLGVHEWLAAFDRLKGVPDGLPEMTVQKSDIYGEDVCDECGRRKVTDQ